METSVALRPRKMRLISHVREDHIQRIVISHLHRRARKGVVYWHTPNGGKRNPAEAARFRKLGVLPGIPDILLFVDGELYGLELKTEQGRLSDEQRAVNHALTTAGAVVATAYGLDHALTLLEQWGIFGR